MSKTYHTKKAFKQKIYNIIQSQEKLSAESGVTTLATEAQFLNAYSKAQKPNIPDTHQERKQLV